HMVTMYFNGMKSDVATISHSDSVRNLLNDMFLNDLNNAKKEIKKRSESIAGQVEEYIISHPNMTVKDLQNDAIFQKIAVQEIGITGYSALTDSDTLFCRFHSNPKIVDVNLESLGGRLPQFWSIMSATRGGKESDGFYDWIEPDGSMAKKYMYISIVNAKTADGVTLSVAATTYIDEYPVSMKVFGESEEYLRDFNRIYEFDNLLLANYKGNIVWDARGKDIGADILSSKMNGSKLAEGFKQARDERDTIMTDYEYSPLDGFLVSFAISPVYYKDEFIGMVVLRANITQIDLIMKDRNGLGDTGEAILVGRDFLLRSNSKYFNYSAILREKSDTDNARLCYTHADTGLTLKAEECSVKSYKDYRGVIVSGRHKYIEEMDYCLIVKIDNSEMYKAIDSARALSYIIYALVFASLIFISFYISRNIARPIKMLANFSGEIGKGNFKARIKMKSTDEINMLAKEMNVMAHDLEKYSRQMKMFSETLEKKVIIKTKKLQDSEAAAINMMEDLGEASKRIAEEKNSVEEKVRERTIELQKAYEDLKKLDIAKEEFISILSHELRTPLFPIIGYVNMVIDGKMGKITPVQKEKFAIVAKCAANLNRLIGDMLDMSKLELKKVKLDIRKENISEIAKESFDGMLFQSKNKSIALKFDAPHKVEAECDRKRILQVINNLISNAIKFTKIKGEIGIRVWKENDNAFVSVKDNGIGISADEQKQLFSRFYQVRKGLQREYGGGTGLGLAISKGIVDLHKGNIIIKSSLNKGSTFIFSIPLKSRMKK
ncbi:MAG: ATP-binding protein, partial [Nanoarchaeota archaeon]